MQKTARVALFLLTTLVLSGCGVKAKGTPTRPWNGKTDNPLKPNCSNVATYVEAFTFQYKHTAPAAIAVKFPGETDNHFSECTQPPAHQIGVNVSTDRSSDLTQFTVSVNLNGQNAAPGGGYTTPPSQTIQVLDMHGCNGAAGTPIFTADATNPVNLIWVSTTPQGPSCPAYNTTSHVEQIPTDVE